MWRFDYDYWDEKNSFSIKNFPEFTRSCHEPLAAKKFKPHHKNIVSTFQCHVQSNSMYVISKNMKKLIRKLIKNLYSSPFHKTSRNRSNWVKQTIAAAHYREGKLTEPQKCGANRPGRRLPAGLLRTRTELHRDTVPVTPAARAPEM